MEELASQKNTGIAINKKAEEQEKKEAKKGTRTYEFSEVVEATKKYFKGDELAASVWANKYALKDSMGRIYELTPDDMWRKRGRQRLGVGSGTALSLLILR